MNTVTTQEAVGKSLAPTFSIAKVEVDTGMAFIAAAQKGMTTLADLNDADASLDTNVIATHLECFLMLLNHAERYARQASQTLDALVDGGAK